MSGFSAAWLALREPADRRARNRELAQALGARFATRGAVRVADLGCGTGANLRAVAPLLGSEQSWTLIDHDAALLEAAGAALQDWAEKAVLRGDRLELEREGQRIGVHLRRADLATGLEAALGVPDLVTASALFDLASPEFVRRVAAAVARHRAVFYTVLTYNGVQRWKPRHPADNAMTAAFHRHQMRDKGLGPAAGPTAPAHICDQFRLMGYSVLEGESPWVLGPSDTALLRELEAGFVEAVRETGAVDEKTLQSWSRLPRSGCEVGHTDILAFPG